MTKFIPAVGFWVGRRGAEGPLGLPHPNDLPATPDPGLADLLEAGQVVLRYRGFSVCRVCGGQNGSTEQSNGHWMWPSGLAHVVRDHGVELPPAFVDSVKQAAPRRFPDEADVQADLSDWLRWAASRVGPASDLEGALTLEQARGVVARLQTPGSTFALDGQPPAPRLLERRSTSPPVVPRLR